MNPHISRVDTAVGLLAPSQADVLIVKLVLEHLVLLLQVRSDSEVLRVVVQDHDHDEHHQVLNDQEDFPPALDGQVKDIRCEDHQGCVRDDAHNGQEADHVLPDPDVLGLPREGPLAQRHELVSVSLDLQDVEHPVDQRAQGEGHTKEDDVAEVHDDLQVLVQNHQRLLLALLLRGGDVESGLLARLHHFLDLLLFALPQGPGLEHGRADLDDVEDHVEREHDPEVVVEFFHAVVVVAAVPVLLDEGDVVETDVVVDELVADLLDYQAVLVLSLRLVVLPVVQLDGHGVVDQVHHVDLQGVERGDQHGAPAPFPAFDQDGPIEKQGHRAGHDQPDHEEGREAGQDLPLQLDLRVEDLLQLAGHGVPHEFAHELLPLDFLLLAAARAELQGPEVGLPLPLDLEHRCPETDHDGEGQLDPPVQGGFVVVLAVELAVEPDSQAEEAQGQQLPRVELEPEEVQAELFPEVASDVL